jgi:hypothetical protein
MRAWRNLPAARYAAAFPYLILGARYERVREAGGDRQPGGAVRRSALDAHNWLRSYCGQSIGSRAHGSIA